MLHSFKLLSDGGEIIFFFLNPGLVVSQSESGLTAGDDQRQSCGARDNDRQVRSPDTNQCSSHPGHRPAQSSQLSSGENIKFGAKISSRLGDMTNSSDHNINIGKTIFSPKNLTKSL